MVNVAEWPNALGCGPGILSRVRISSFTPIKSIVKKVMGDRLMAGLLPLKEPM